MKRSNSISLIILISGVLLAAVLVAGCGVKPASDGDSGTGGKASYSAAQEERGKELIEEWKCNFCHTPEVAGPGGKAAPDPGRLLSGHPADEKIPEMGDMIMGTAEYLEFLDNLDNTVWASDDRLVFSANITPDNETGIGAWTEEMFVETMREGRHMGLGRRILYPMPWRELGELDDAELTAIYAYLRTVKPVENRVPPPVMLFR
ncbi:MAG: c-type cytochrome [Deltaproteobacteria bacterium]